MPDDKNRDLAAVNSAIESLDGQFDFVHIFAGRHEGSDCGTVNISRGTGDWFSRIGKIRDYLIYSEEMTRAKARQDFEKENQ